MLSVKPQIRMRTMKMTFNRMGWLVMAAAFIMSFAACSNEDNETNVQPKTIHVSVGAGVGNDETTRSEMVFENGNRVLTFTEGDRLYVCEELGYCRCLAGYLTMKEGSLSPDRKSATFEGDLKVYDYDYNSNPTVVTSYDFGGADPLSIYTAYAYLVHKDMVEGEPASGAHYYISNTLTFTYNSINLVAPDVKTFMESALRVRGKYNSTTKTFELSKRNYAIFNCNISGLTPNQEYGFTIYDGDGDSLGGVHYTTNSSGVASFVFSVECEDYDSFKLHVINYSTSDDKYFPLTITKLEPKIYNVTRTWE